MPVIGLLAVSEQMRYLAAGTQCQDMRSCHPPGAIISAKPRPLEDFAEGFRQNPCLRVFDVTRWREIRSAALAATLWLKLVCVGSRVKRLSGQEGIIALGGIAVLYLAFCLYARFLAFIEKTRARGLALFLDRHVLGGPVGYWLIRGVLLGLFLWVPKRVSFIRPWGWAWFLGILAGFLMASAYVQRRMLRETRGIDTVTLVDDWPAAVSVCLIMPLGEELDRALEINLVWWLTESPWIALLATLPAWVANHLRSLREDIKNGSILTNVLGYGVGGLAMGAVMIQAGFLYPLILHCAQNSFAVLSSLNSRVLSRPHNTVRITKNGIVQEAAVVAGSPSDDTSE